MANSHSIWTKLDRFPPVIVRLLATDNGRLLTDSELVFASNKSLTMSDIKRLSHLTRWDDVTIKHMREFCVACRVDFSDPIRMKHLTRLLKNGYDFASAQKSPRWTDYLETLKTLV